MKACCEGKISYCNNAIYIQQFIWGSGVLLNNLSFRPSNGNLDNRDQKFCIFIHAI